MSVQTDYDARTALLVVDMQNDFAHPDGNLYVDGGEHIVSTVNAAIEAADRAGATVVYTQDWHPASTPHFEKDGGVWPTHCVKETWGAELHDELRVLAGAPRVRKGTGGWDGYSGFTIRDPETGEESPTELEQLLRDTGVERVVVCGLAQDVCVKETVLDALRLGFDTVVLTDATRPVDLEPGDGDRAATAMHDAGATLA